MMPHEQQRADTLKVREDALTPDKQEEFKEYRRRLTLAVRHYSQGPLPAAAYLQIDDWALTKTETGTLPQSASWTPESYQKAIDAEEAKELARTYKLREQAKQLLQAEKAKDFTPPSPMNLDALIAVANSDDHSWRIDGLLPAGGRALFTAPYKGGKSTIISNLIRSLADGDPFLDRFTVTPTRLHRYFENGVLLIDTEMTPAQLGRWLDDQNIRNRDLVEVLTLRGQLSQFNVLDPDIRFEWVKAIEGSEVVILDNLRPVLDALGLDENREAGKFLTAWDEFMAEMGVTESIIVHHTGHGSDRARGDSALLASNDAIWSLIRDGDDASSPRFFKALGRDIDVPESRLEFDPATRRLALTGGNRKNAKAEEAIPAILDLLRGHDALSGRAIERELTGGGLTQKQVRDGLLLVRQRKQVLTYEGARKSIMHSINPVQPETNALVRQSALPVRQRGDSECVSASIEDALHLQSYNEDSTISSPTHSKTSCPDHPITPRPEFCRTCQTNSEFQAQTQGTP